MLLFQHLSIVIWEEIIVNDETNHVNGQGFYKQSNVVVRKKRSTKIRSNPENTGSISVMTTGDLQTTNIYKNGNNIADIVIKVNGMFQTGQIQENKGI